MMSLSLPGRPLTAAVTWLFGWIPTYVRAVMCAREDLLPPGAVAEYFVTEEAEGQVYRRSIRVRVVRAFVACEHRWTPDGSPVDRGTCHLVLQDGKELRCSWVTFKRAKTSLKGSASIWAPSFGLLGRCEGEAKDFTLLMAGGQRL